MTASVRIQLEARNALAIPARAIRQEGGRTVVHVVNGSGIDVRPIRVGWRDGPWAEIVAGVAEGERILLSAATINGEEAK
jgi:Cu(I)/Ag(I) efflux system membrane fusion protein